MDRRRTRNLFDDDDSEEEKIPIKIDKKNHEKSSDDEPVVNKNPVP